MRNGLFRPFQEGFQHGEEGRVGEVREMSAAQKEQVRAANTARELFCHIKRRIAVVLPQNTAVEHPISDSSGVWS